MKFAVILLVFSLFLAAGQANGQLFSKADYPHRIASLSAYKASVQKNPSLALVNPQQLTAGIIYDLRYATSNNFTSKCMYPSTVTASFLRLPAATALQKAATLLEKKGLGLKIFDAYRPYQVTVEFWNLIQDERYVAFPAKGSGHNRGIAVDLTLIELQSGKELEMGTGFDNFTDTAHHSFTQLPEMVLQNRALLKEVMEQVGFKALDTEWWHYALPNADAFPLLDIPFKKLRPKKIK